MFKSTYKKHKFPKESFIRGWYVDDDVSDYMIKLFNSNKHLAGKGGIWNNEGKIKHLKKIKDSSDLEISPSADHPLLEKYKKNLSDFIQLYEKEFSEMKSYNAYSLNKNFNIQHYVPGGGFKVWHSENGSLATSTRVLVFMTYLNNVPNGGTMFKYQKLISPAKKGLTLLWPPDFSHTHKGEISKTHEKYIATGWLNFD